MPPPQNDFGGGYEDPEGPKNFSFDDQSVRKGFIRKVYMILMVSVEWSKLFHRSFQINPFHIILGTIVGDIRFRCFVRLQQGHQGFCHEKPCPILGCIGRSACYNDLHGLL